MLVCQRNADLEPNSDSQEDVDWAHAYPNLEEMPSRQRESASQQSFTTSADPGKLEGKELKAYTTVRDHIDAESPPPLRMIVSGTAGTGKSYLIHCFSFKIMFVWQHPQLWLHSTLKATPPCPPAFASQR